MDVTEQIREVASHLGPLPISLRRLMNITASPEFDFADIIEVVSHDMLLAAAVLRRANAADAAAVERIHTVRDAVLRIGATQTLAAAMHSVVGNSLQRDLSLYHDGKSDLWRHSSAASVGATLIRSAAAVPLPTSVGTTALLHDIGKVVLDAIDRPATTAPIHAIGADACIQERELFGIDHAQAGVIVAQLWRLPNAIVEGIGAHHELVDDALPSAICLADYVAHAAEHDTDDAPLEQLAASATSARVILGIDTETLQEIIATTQRQVADLLDRFEPAPTS